MRGDALHYEPHAQVPATHTHTDYNDTVTTFVSLSSSITSLPAFSDQDVVVHVPPEAEGTEISHFALYCRSNNVRYLYYNIPPLSMTDTYYPAPPPPPLQQVGLVTILVPDGLIPIAPTLPPVEDEVSIGSLRTRAHGVRGNVFALNQKTLKLTNFHYDGNAPGTYMVSLFQPLLLP